MNEPNGSEFQPTDSRAHYIPEWKRQLLMWYFSQEKSLDVAPPRRRIKRKKANEGVPARPEGPFVPCQDLGSDQPFAEG